MPAELQVCVRPVGGAGGAGGATATVTCEVAVPPVPLQLSVYVVLLVGDTLRVPDVLTEPTPELMVQEEAFSEDQVSVLDWPEVIESGFA